MKKLFPLLLLATSLTAAPLKSILGETLSPGKGGIISVPMQILLLLTALTLLPAIVMSITPFLRITIVLHFLRQALGTQSTPSNQVLIGLSLFLTMLIINPVASEIYTKAWAPLESGQMTQGQALDEGAKPLQVFLTRLAGEKDVQLFLEISHTPARRPTPAILICWC